MLNDTFSDQSFVTFKARKALGWLEMPLYIDDKRGTNVVYKAMPYLHETLLLLDLL